MSYGLQIEIVRLRGDAERAEYEFFVAENGGGIVVAHPTGRPGIARVDLATGAVTLVEPCPDDADGRIFGRVGAKLARHWREGALPERTGWAG